MITTLALLAGGLATRLHPVTQQIPKSLIEINGRPFIVYQLELLKKNGIRRVVMCVGFLGNKIQEVVGDGKKLGIEVEYSFDGDQLLGTGGALRKALPLLGDTFFVMYGDSYLPINFANVSNFFENQAKGALMTVIKNNNQWDKSNVIFEEGAIIYYDKVQTQVAMHHIDYGLEIFTAKALGRVNEGVRIDLADIFKDLIKHGDMVGYEVHERFYEIGSFSGIEDMKKYLP